MLLAANARSRVGFSPAQVVPQGGLHVARVEQIGGDARVGSVIGHQVAQPLAEAVAGYLLQGLAEADGFIAKTVTTPMVTVAKAA